MHRTNGLSQVRSAVAINEHLQKRVLDTPTLLTHLEAAMVCPELHRSPSERSRIYTYMADVHKIGDDPEKELGAVQSAIAALNLQPSLVPHTGSSCALRKQSSLQGTHGAPAKSQPAQTARASSQNAHCMNFFSKSIVFLVLIGICVGSYCVPCTSGHASLSTVQCAHSQTRGHIADQVSLNACAVIIDSDGCVDRDSRTSSESDASPPADGKLKKSKFSWSKLFSRSSSKTSYQVNESQSAMMSHPHYSAHPTIHSLSKCCLILGVMHILMSGSCAANGRASPASMSDDDGLSRGSQHSARNRPGTPTLPLSTGCDSSGQPTPAALSRPRSLSSSHITQSALKRKFPAPAYNLVHPCLTTPVMQL